MKTIDEIILANKLERQATARNHKEIQAKKIAFNKKCRDIARAKGNNETFAWSQINKALMHYGMRPSNIANVLSFLNEEKRIERGQ